MLLCALLITLMARPLDFDSRARGRMLQRAFYLALLLCLAGNLLVFYGALDDHAGHVPGHASPMTSLLPRDAGRPASVRRAGVRPRLGPRRRDAGAAAPRSAPRRATAAGGDGGGGPVATATRPGALMIIAAYPSSAVRLEATWSQLECFAPHFDRVVISAPVESRSIIERLLAAVDERLPSVGQKATARYYVNDRYDAGLWCDALLKEGYLRPNGGHNQLSWARLVRQYVGGTSAYDRFLLINDSMMAVEHTNMFLEALAAKNASLVSLNYWGDKAAGYRNVTDRKKYWLESPLRAFDLAGVQVYADKICALPTIHWRQHCKHMWTTMYGSGNEFRKKRCIVEHTEMTVVDHYNLEKVHGLFPGHDGERHWNDQMGLEELGQWGKNYTYWTHLRKEGFPALKNSDPEAFEQARRERPRDVKRCTSKLPARLWK